MSNYVYPATASLPQVVEQDRTTDFSDTTQVFKALSGKESRLAYGAAPRRSYTVEHPVLRETAAAPAPYAAIMEADLPEWFYTTHAGTLDSFLFVDPFTGSQVRVRFVEGAIKSKRHVDGWRHVSFQVIEVL